MKRKATILVLIIAMMTLCLATPALASAQEADPAEQETVQLAKTKISSTILSTHAMKIQWKKVAGAKKYTLYVAAGKNIVKQKNTKKLSYEANDLKKGTKYTIIVKAKAAGATASKTVKTVRMPARITRGMAGFSKTNAGRLIKIARSKLGKSYVSGGSGPNVFDCSGYVYYITKRSHSAGITSGKLIRSSDSGELSQMRRMRGAKYVGRSYSKAQPGDIVFMGGHVAFYYGNNQLIHATNPRVDVAITSIWWSGGPGRVVAIYRLPEM
ncbi:MAG: NlpC/P60 family protein [Eubacteriales bacterium]|nr:NlpC/P60 family protein [Eubacteriales bacterium]